MSERVYFFSFPDAATVKARSLQDMTRSANAEAIADQEAAEQEQRVDEDDENTLAQKRALDEYKDTHRRGWGNRYNRS